MLQTFFQWDKFITPQIIKLFYYLMLVSLAFAGLSGVLSSFAMMRYMGFFYGLFYLLAILIGVILGGILIRILTELIMVTFSINDNLREIKENSRR